MIIGKNKIVEFYDYVSPEVKIPYVVVQFYPEPNMFFLWQEESEEEGDEPSDGLTSTQRSKLKKQQLKAPFTKLTLL